MMYNVIITIANKIHESQTDFVVLIWLAESECVVLATTAEPSSSEINIATTDRNAKM